MNGTESRLWCRRTLPSIYSFVQDHYWYVHNLVFGMSLLMLAGIMVYFVTGLCPMSRCSPWPAQC
jgi:phosphatidylinositol glycan class V